MLATDTDLLLDLVARKHDCLAQLRDLADSQLRLIDQERMTELMQVLAAKQQLLGLLHDVERKLVPFRGQDPAGRCWRTADQRRQCGLLLDECQALLAETLACEQQGETLLRERRDQAAARMADAAQGGHARDAYALHVPSGPQRLDLCSER